MLDFFFPFQIVLIFILVLLFRGLSVPVWFSWNFYKADLVHELSLLHLVCNALILLAFLDNDLMVIFKDAVFVLNLHWVFCKLSLIYKVSNGISDSHALKFLFEILLILQLAKLLQMLLSFKQSSVLLFDNCISKIGFAWFLLLWHL